MFFTRTVKLAWDSQVLVVLLQVITWLTNIVAAWTFYAFLSPRENGDLRTEMGTQWGPKN